ncbi:MAG: aspartoacylase [Cyanobacteria bacterium J069]|nr:MAG: aspartoacylase [Cyanobacteria bacterium J069]
MNKIQRVLIVGGTHGNELTGVYLVQRFEQQPHLVQRPSFDTRTLLSNQAAIAAGVRYVDQDMNRCCDRQSLATPTPAAYEVARAQEISRHFGTTGSTPADVILDLHSTTANMGLTLILDDHHPFKLQLAAALSAQQPALRVYSSANSGRQQDALRSLGRFGFCLEVGPVAQGVLEADLFHRTEALVLQTLDYLDRLNQDTPTTAPHPLTLYQYLGTVPYPKDSKGRLQAMIHPQLQGQDYQPLHPGDPMFLSLTGETIAYAGEDPVFPVFINEAAYYEKDIAMVLTRPQQIEVETWVEPESEARTCR